MTLNLRRPVRASLVALVLVACPSGCAGPSVAPASDVGAGGSCDALAHLGPRPTNVELDALWAAVDASRWDDAVELGESIDADLRIRVRAVFHGAEVDASSAREFLRRWVQLDAPVLVVDVDRFRWSEPIGGALVLAASRAGQVERGRAWLRDTAASPDVTRFAVNCLDASSVGVSEGSEGSAGAAQPPPS